MTLVMDEKTTDGDSDVLNLNTQDWTAGCVDRDQVPKLAIQVFGTFDGCTVTVQGSLDGTNYSPLDNGEFTTALIRTYDCRAMKIKATVSSAGASTSVSMIVA